MQLTFCDVNLPDKFIGMEVRQHGHEKDANKEDCTQEVSSYQMNTFSVSCLVDGRLRGVKRTGNLDRPAGIFLYALKGHGDQNQLVAESCI